MSIGDYSVATGVGTTASGLVSTATGYFTVASGDSSTALGAKTNATGEAASWGQPPRARRASGASGSRRGRNLPEQPETWVEVDDREQYEIRAGEQFTRCGWTPFEGWKVKGRVRRVVLRGQTAFEDGKVLVDRGYGRNVRE